MLSELTFDFFKIRLHFFKLLVQNVILLPHLLNLVLLGLILDIELDHVVVTHRRLIDPRPQLLHPLPRPLKLGLELGLLLRTDMELGF